MLGPNLAPLQKRYLILTVEPSIQPHSFFLSSFCFPLSTFSLLNFVCHTCFKRQEKLHRCGQCKFAHYCDRTCQKDAWLNHKNECSAIKRYGKVPNENIRSEGLPMTGLGVFKCQAGTAEVTAFPAPECQAESQCLRSSTPVTPLGLRGTLRDTVIPNCSS